MGFPSRPVTTTSTTTSRLLDLNVGVESGADVEKGFWPAAVWAPWLKSSAAAANAHVNIGNNVCPARFLLTIPTPGGCITQPHSIPRVRAFPHLGSA